MTLATRLARFEWLGSLGGLRGLVGLDGHTASNEKALVEDDDRSFRQFRRPFVFQATRPPHIVC